jgi:hypothetical protein
LCNLVSPGAGDTTSIEIAGRLPVKGKYDERLETGKRIVGHPDKIQALSSPDGAFLMFDVPAQVLAGDDSRFVIRQKSGIANSYWFTASKY